MTEDVERLKRELEELGRQSSAVAGDARHAENRRAQIKLIDRIRRAGHEPFPVESMSKEDLEGEYLQLRRESSHEDDADRLLLMTARMNKIMDRLVELGHEPGMPIGWQP